MSTILPKLSTQEIATGLQQLDGWQLIDEITISKTYAFKGYWKTIAFVNSIAWIAQKHNHHPDLEVYYGKVVVKFTTHDSGGLTALDFELANAIETVPF